VFAIR